MQISILIHIFPIDLLTGSWHIKNTAEWQTTTTALQLLLQLQLQQLLQLLWLDSNWHLDTSFLLTCWLADGISRNLQYSNSVPLQLQQLQLHDPSHLKTLQDDRQQQQHYNYNNYNYYNLTKASQLQEPCRMIAIKVLISYTTREERFHIDSVVMGTHPLFGALSWRMFKPT